MDSYREVLDYLLANKLVRAADVVEGGLQIHEFSRRHRNLRVLFGDGRGYFIKIGGDADRRASLAREAEVYRSLSSSLPNGLRRSLLVQAHRFDSERGVLVLELLPGFENLWRVQSRRRRFLPRLTQRLGRALGRFHRCSRRDELANSPAVFFQPTAVGLLAPSKRFIADCSPAVLELIGIIQTDRVLYESIGGIQKMWLQEPPEGRAFVHGDLRFENCCVDARGRRMRLVDWEFGGLGDALWDAGCVLAGLLSSWIRHAPMPQGASPADHVRFSIPAETMQEAARAFWLAYIGQPGQPRRESWFLLERTMLYAAARLVQLAFEELFRAPRLSMHAVTHMQLSRNICDRPVDAAIHLLGIPA